MKIPTIISALTLYSRNLKKLIPFKYLNFSNKKDLELLDKPEEINKKLDFRKKRLKTLLWVDDRINPMERKMDWLGYSPVGREVKVVWIKSYTEFKLWLELNGKPDGVCFDYNLGIDAPTGYECAKYLIEFCRRNKLKLPSWSSQCTNPSEKAKINRLLKSANTSHMY